MLFGIPSLSVGQGKSVHARGFLIAFGVLVGSLTSGDAVAQPEPSATAPNPVRDTVQSIHPDAFGTRTLDAGITIYDARFRRVSQADADHPLITHFAERLNGYAALSQLARAKQDVESRVQYASDSDNLGVADLWQNAGETLERARGDDEDIAIAEMQILKAAGFPAENLYLTIGRHPRLGSHVILLARVGEDYFALDHLVQGVIPARQGQSFRPMISIGPGRSWLHGYTLDGKQGSHVRTAAR